MKKSLIFNSIAILLLAASICTQSHAMFKFNYHETKQWFVNHPNYKKALVIGATIAPMVIVPSVLACTQARMVTESNGYTEWNNISFDNTHPYLNALAGIGSGLAAGCFTYNYPQVTALTTKASALVGLGGLALATGVYVITKAGSQLAKIITQ